MSKTLSALTEASTFSTTDIFGMVVGGNSRKVAISSLFAMVAKSTLAAGTLTADSPLQQTQTWNNAAVTFTGIKQNITDTASAAGSLLMDLQVGGSSKFSVRKDGQLNIKKVGGSIDAALVTYDSGAGVKSGFYFPNGGADLGWTRANTAIWGLGFLRCAISATSVYAWSASADPLGTSDLVLARDAAGVLAQRDGANPQAFRLYNTYTDASNYERGYMRWSGNVLQMGTEAAGTGTARSLLIKNGEAGGASILFTTGQIIVGYSIALATATGQSRRVAFYPIADNVVRLKGTSDGVGGAFQFEEMTAPPAPSTNEVRIYAEDNGSGKTRLMALFATGAAQQIAIEP